MSREVLVSTLIGAVVGIAAAWFFAKFYYQRAGDELRSEAAELRRRTDMILTGLERGGFLELHRDPKTGAIDSILVRLQGTIRATPAMGVGQLTVKNPPDGTTV